MVTSPADRLEQGAARTGANGDGAAAPNVSAPERLVSTLGGGALAAYGLSRGSTTGGLLTLAGGYLLLRGVTGHCMVYQAMGLDTATEPGRLLTRLPAGGPVKVERAITIDRPAADLYRFWRDFENLPRFMDHLLSVRANGDRRSHWVAKAPAGASVEWDAEVTDDVPDARIAWRSLEGADVANAGAVSFSPAPAGRGTEVRVSLEYNPPGGPLGVAVAKLFGEEPDIQVREDLRRFKRLMEVGAIPTTEGQPSGREKVEAGR
jgi:uncharacterized membrane protein